MKTLQKLLHLFEKIILNISMVLLSMIPLLVFFQVIMRRLGISVMWTEEMARYAYVGFVFLAFSVVTLHGKHIKIDMVFDKFPPTLRRYIDVSYHLLATAFMIICVYSMTLNLTTARRVVTVTVPWLKLNHLYMVVVIGMAFTVLTSIIRTLQLVLNKLPDEQTERQNESRGE